MTTWLISGSRDFPDEKLARAVFRSQFSKDDKVFHGGARGVDTWADEEARKKQAIVTKYPADWEAYGKAAGPIRNAVMFESWLEAKGYRRALVLWDGQSHGTNHMLKLINDAGAPLTLVRADYD